MDVSKLNLIKAETFNRLINPHVGELVSYYNVINLLKNMEVAYPRIMLRMLTTVGVFTRRQKGMYQLRWVSNDTLLKCEIASRIIIKAYSIRSTKPDKLALTYLKKQKLI